MQDMNYIGKSYKVIRNTYPRHAGAAHAEPGDLVCWVAIDTNQLQLKRISDGKTVFSPPRRKNSASDFTFPESGIIAQVKKHNYILEIEVSEALCQKVKS